MGHQAFGDQMPILTHTELHSETFYKLVAMMGFSGALNFTLFGKASLVLGNSPAQSE